MASPLARDWVMASLPIDVPQPWHQMTRKKRAFLAFRLTAAPDNGPHHTTVLVAGVFDHDTPDNTITRPAGRALEMDAGAEHNHATCSAPDRPGHY